MCARAASELILCSAAVRNHSLNLHAVSRPLRQVRVQHSTKDAEITGLEQCHVQSDGSRGQGEADAKSARIAQRSCLDQSVPPDAADDEKQVRNPCWYCDK